MPYSERLVTKVITQLKHLPISRIIVFGSSADGTTTADSDLDIAVIVQEPARFENYDQRLEAKSEIRACLDDINQSMPIDLLLYSEEEYAELLRKNGFIATEVAAKGQTVYEAAS